MNNPVRRVSRRKRFTRLAALTSAALGLTALPAAAYAAPARQVYVAMGDSFAAGPLIFPQSDLLTCVRSSANYPGLLAHRLKPAAFRDVTCSNATTANFAGPQPGNVAGVAAPQYDALSADTTLVTVQIGGNDIGIIGLVLSCIDLLPPGPDGAPALGPSCAAANTAGGVDQYAKKIDAFAPTYGKVIDEIHRRAPQARIVLVGYPTGIRHDGCWPFVPVVPQDANYVQAVLDRLDQRMSEQAAQHNASYVDTRTPSTTHDACAPLGTKWIEGLIPTVIDNGSMPLHPNAAGMAAIVPEIQATLTS